MGEFNGDLTALEAMVFGIEPRLRNALAIAHDRYTDFVGLTYGRALPRRDGSRRCKDCLQSTKEGAECLLH